MMLANARVQGNAVTQKKRRTLCSIKSTTVKVAVQSKFQKGSIFVTNAGVGTPRISLPAKERVTIRC